MVDLEKSHSSLKVTFPELLAKLMEWMTMWRFAADVEQHGRSIRINASVKTSSANPVGCTEPWSSSMDQRSAYLGRGTLTRKHSVSRFLTASQSCLALGLVDTLTAPTPTMS
jgi:hypothetical protein